MFRLPLVGQALDADTATRGRNTEPAFMPEAPLTSSEVFLDPGREIPSPDYIDQIIDETNLF